MHRVFLALGGNIGNLSLNFTKAVTLIEKKCGTIIRASSVYKTPPLGFECKDFFYNQVMEVETCLDPRMILSEVLSIEKKQGRMRVPGKLTSRTMDIDILYYDSLVTNARNLVIPHPRIQERKFVLVPLVEIAPDFVHPVLKKTNQELLDECRDFSTIIKACLPEIKKNKE